MNPPAPARKVYFTERLPFTGGDQPPVKAKIVMDLLAQIEGRVDALDRKIDAIAINAVRVADRVAGIAPTPKA